MLPIEISSQVLRSALPDSTKSQLFLMDVEQFLDSLPSKPIFDLVVTSPPYNIGKEYEKQVPLNEYILWQKKIIQKIYSRYRFHVTAIPKN